jgi:hypothetical protein
VETKISEIREFSESSPAWKTPFSTRAFNVYFAGFCFFCSLQSSKCLQKINNMQVNWVYII